MADEAKFPDIPGASDLFAWFGFWPSFHDGEVLSLHLDRAGSSQLRVHTWEGTHQVDSRGYGVLWPCYGISGEIKARSVRIELAPGMPPDS